MSVKNTNTSKTIVIVANTFNPSILKESWLKSNEILSEDDLNKGFVYSNVGVQASSKDFTLNATQNHLQLSLTNEGNSSAVNRSIKKIVELLPHVNYIAIGINFTWGLEPLNTNVAELSKKLFYNAQSSIFNNDEEGTYYGGYISQASINESRMKLDIKPSKIMSIDQPESAFEQLRFNFNYHHDLIQGEDKNHSFLLNVLSKWEEYFDNSSKFMDTVLNKLK